MDKPVYFQNILFNKIREVRSPERANTHDAGIDFFMPEINEQFVMDFLHKNVNNNSIITQKCLIVPPGNRVLIPSGIRVWIQDKQSALIAANKSGRATKDGIIFMAQVVDADYTGEVHMGIHNLSAKNLILKEGDKVIQFLHMPIYMTQMIEVDNDTYNQMTQDTDRGQGGFGSTEGKRGELFPQK